MKTSEGASCTTLALLDSGSWSMATISLSLSLSLWPSSPPSSLAPWSSSSPSLPPPSPQPSHHFYHNHYDSVNISTNTITFIIILIVKYENALYKPPKNWKQTLTQSLKCTYMCGHQSKILRGRNNFHDHHWINGQTCLDDDPFDGHKKNEVLTRAQMWLTLEVKEGRLMTHVSPFIGHPEQTHCRDRKWVSDWRWSLHGLRVSFLVDGNV